MKIDNTGKPVANQPARPSEATRANAASKAYSSTARSTDSATVNITPVASQLNAIENQLKTAPAVDTERVAEIRQAIKEGRFSINPEAIADKLVASVKELLGNG